MSEHEDLSLYWDEAESRRREQLKRKLTKDDIAKEDDVDEAKAKRPKNDEKDQIVPTLQVNEAENEATETVEVNPDPLVLTSQDEEETFSSQNSSFSEASSQNGDILFYLDSSEYEYEFFEATTAIYVGAEYSNDSDVEE